MGALKQNDNIKSTDIVKKEQAIKQPFLQYN